MAHQIKLDDITAMVPIRCGDVILDTTGSEPWLQVPMFPKGTGTEPGHVASVQLFPDQRPSLTWSQDRAQMYQQYSTAGCQTAFTDGTYGLDSQQNFKLTITNGVPTREDFISHDDNNKAWCCPDAKSFILEDPTLEKRKSTFVQVTDRLLVECSPNSQGKVFLWRREEV